jgi:hypothetical protein
MDSIRQNKKKVSKCLTNFLGYDRLFSEPQRQPEEDSMNHRTHQSEKNHSTTSATPATHIA